MPRLFICIMFVFFLVACQSGDGNDAAKEAAENEKEEVEQNEEAEEIEQEETEQADEEEVDEAVDDELDVAGVLYETSQAMAEVTSFKTIGVITSNQSNQFQDSEITWDVEIDVNYDNGRILHEFITTEDQRGEPSSIEVYTDGEYQYSRGVDTENKEWTKMEDFIGGFQHYNILIGKDLELYADYPEYFQLEIDETYYTVTFPEEDQEMFQTLVYGTLKEKPDDVLRNADPDYEMTGTIQIVIDKETMLPVEWEMTYDAKANTEQVGDYHNVESAHYTIGHYGEFNDLTIPAELLDLEAVD